MRDLNALPLEQLFAALTRGDALRRLLELARDEDLGTRDDVTARCFIDKNARGKAAIITRQAGVISGLPTVSALLETFAADAAFSPRALDGDSCEAGQCIGRLEGALRDVLAVERTLLNLLGRLCGIATLTRRYVDAVRGEQAVICDTRKTTPGLRALEKYAVRCGGGTLHRIGLFDAVLLKDNHIAHLKAGELTAAVNHASRTARAEGDVRFVGVEVDTFEQLDAVLACERDAVDLILLDNMPPERMRAAVRRRDDHAPWIQLEASGGVTLESIATVAATGIDRISIGAITHHAVSLDVALDVQ